MEHDKAYCTLIEIIPQCSWLSTPTATMEPKKMADKNTTKNQSFRAWQV